MDTCCESCGSALANAQDVCGSQQCSIGVQLTPAQAVRTLAQRVAGAQDRARQRMVRLGFRPYNVDLVWSKWSGDERGAGYESVMKRTPLVPNPVVVDLSTVSMSAVATGILPMGSIRIEKVSACFTSDQLLGRLLGEGGTPEPYDFYYEVYEDGRSGTAQRMKFRPSSHPNRKKYGWQVVLERIIGDAKRDGTPVEAK